MSSSADTEAMIRSIAREAGELPTRSALRLETALLLAVIAALGVAVGLIFLYYGIQPDLQATVAGAPFRHKVISMLVLGCGGFLLVASAGRPGASRFWVATLLPGLALLAYGAIGDRSGLSFLGRGGTSVPSCLGIIILLSIPALAIVLAVLRSSGVVTRPALAGATAGILAGAIGAAAYALACRNDGGLFVAAWYSAAVTAMAALGSLAGRRWLAW
jgi:hypothetical protein